MADDTRNVDVDADAGGNGTTNALTGANCAYKSLSIAEAAGSAGSAPYLDCVANAQNYYINCGSNHATTHTADTTAVTFDGWTTNSSYKIYVSADATSKAGTAWSATKYRLEISSGSQAINNTEDVVIDGLQVKMSRTNASAICVQNVGPGVMVVKNCFLWNTYSGSSYFGQCVYGIDSTTYIINCIGISRSTLNNARNAVFNAFYNAATAAVYAYNCTAIGCRYGYSSVSTGATMTAKNCYGGGGSSSRYFTSGGGVLNQTTCAASDTTAADAALDSIAYSTSQFTNVTTDTEDLSLVSGSALIGVGTDISESAPLNYTTDINGATRTSTWDIGADEYVVASGHPAIRRMGGIPFVALNRGVW